MYLCIYYFFSYYKKHVIAGHLHLLIENGHSWLCLILQFKIFLWYFLFTLPSENEILGIFSLEGRIRPVIYFLKYISSVSKRRIFRFVAKHYITLQYLSLYRIKKHCWWQFLTQIVAKIRKRSSFRLFICYSYNGHLLQYQRVLCIYVHTLLVITTHQSGLLT